MMPCGMVITLRSFVAKGAPQDDKVRTRSLVKQASGELREVIEKSPADFALENFRHAGN
jgi:hypothetical protein